MFVLMWMTSIYLLSILVAYVLQRLILWFDSENAQYQPFGVMFVVLLVPILNVVISASVLLLTILSSENVGPLLKRFYGLTRR
jgi:hypothetical protein